MEFNTWEYIYSNTYKTMLVLSLIMKFRSYEIFNIKKKFTFY